MDTEEQKKTRTAVRRDRAETYLLISLVAFGITVIVVRVFLQVTGFPQVGNSVLHIAHALWGGLLLFAAVLLPLTLANRWAIQVSALLSGIGIGLFIDEVGKLITQTNDYFYPPALALIYGFFLLTVFVYLRFRQPRPEDPREAMYHALEGLQAALDGDLDTEAAALIEAQLASARQSDRDEIVSLAQAISTYLHKEREHLSVVEASGWKRIVTWIDSLGLRLDRRAHRTLISIVLVSWLIFAVSFVVILLLRLPSLTSLVVQWRGLLIELQVIISGLMALALSAWLIGNEERGLQFAVAGFLLSLVAFQSLYFYLSQFAAITTTLLQLAFLLFLLAYRRWYLSDTVVGLPVHSSGSRDAE